MKLCIFGPRDFQDSERLFEQLEKIEEKITEVVSGGAKGADSLGEIWAESKSIPTKIFKPNWNDISVPNAVVKTNKYGQYNAMAGHNRNVLLVNYSDAGFCVFDINARGTNDTLSLFEKANKPVTIWCPDGNLYDF